MNILITAATSAKAYSLKNTLAGDRIFLGDYLELPAFMLSSGNMLKLPNPNSASYMHQMLALCLDNNINTVYLLRDEEARLLHEAEQLFNEYNISLVNEV